MDILRSLSLTMVSRKLISEFEKMVEVGSTGYCNCVLSIIFGIITTILCYIIFSMWEYDEVPD